MNDLSNDNNDKMIEKVELFCIQHHLLQKGQCFVLACSGGPDSMALTDIFWQLQAKYALKLHVAHAEHGIRAEESLQDAAYVKDYCQKHSLPFHLQHLHVPDFAREHKLSEETAARTLRYAFLRQTAKIVQADKILTAHHLNDQAETVLQHLVRGAGMQGLSGMQTVNGDIMRPFLCLSREEIEAYCQRHALEPRHDATNFQPCCERNIIRLNVMPQLLRCNEKAVAAICRSAQLAAQEHSFIAQCAAHFIEQHLQKEHGSVKLPMSELRSQHIAVRREIYRQLIAQLCTSLADISFEHIDKIDDFLYNGRIGAVIELPRNIRITRSYKNLKIFLAAFAGKRAVLAEYNIMANLNGSVLLPGSQKLTIEPVADIFPVTGRNSCFIDAAAVKGKLLIRSRKNGDRMVCKGMNGSKKIKDILIDAKIPAADRNQVPLVCDDDGIIWLAGVRQAARCCADETSSRILHMKLEKIN